MAEQHSVRSLFGRLDAIAVRAALTWLLAVSSMEVQAAAAESKINAPIDIPLIKLEYPGQLPNIRMLYVTVQSIGGIRVRQPLLFDTGSAGVTIECRIVLPKRLCGPEGAAIENDLVVNGLTITPQKLLSRYGRYDEFGNLAYARIAFGSVAKSVTTAEPVPILIRYKKVDRQTGQEVGGPLWPLGTFGVSPAGSQAYGKLKSPVDFVTVGPKLHRGYRLSPVGTKWKTCTNEAGTCPSVRSLRIGIDEASRSGFNFAKIRRASADQNFPTSDMCIAWRGQSSCRPMLFDTGNSTITIAVPSGGAAERSLPVGEPVLITDSAKFNWSFKTTYRPEVEFVEDLAHHIVGIRYFEENSFLVDLDTQELGLRLGR